MTSKVSNDAFQAIFPRYAELLSQQSLPANESIEVFLREELPRKVEMVRGMESCFNSFLTHFTNLILKRPQHAHLLHALSLKANDKIEKYFQSLSLAAHKLDNNSLKDFLPSSDPQALRKEFRAKLESIGNLLKDKYYNGGSLSRQCQQQVAMRLYTLLEIHYVLKGDPVALAGKFRIREQDVLWSVSRNDQPSDIGSLITLDPNFINTVQEVVIKRCRPFVNRRELLQSKVRQVLREGQSKTGPNMNLFVQSVLSKERGRVGRQLSSSLTRQLRSLQEGEGQTQAKQLISETQTLKRQFTQLKNTTYFLDMMRGNFSDKYKMEIHRLQNVFYLTNLQKYLQDVSTFLEKVLNLQEKVIRNRRDYMRDFGGRVQLKIADLISFYQTKPTSQNLSEVINQQFDLLESALYGVVNKQQVPINDDYKRREERERKDADRKYQMEQRAEQQRLKREQQKAKLEQRKRKQQERIRLARIEREEKDRQRREEAQRQEQDRRAQLERRRQEKSRKDEELRRIREAELRQKQQQRRQRQAQEKNKRQELLRKKGEEERKKILDKQQENRRRQEQRKRILERQQQQKRKRQNQLKSKKQREEQDRLKRQNQRKAQQDRIKRERQQKELDQRKREEERTRLQKQKREREQRQLEERKKEEQRNKQEREKQERQKRQAEEKKRQQERRDKQRRDIQEKQRKQRQKRERQALQLKKQEERQKQIQKQKQQKQKRQKQLKQQKQREKAAEQERLALQKEEKRRRQQQQKRRNQQQRKDREQRQRQQRERAQRERQEKQRIEKQKRQRQKAERQRQQKQRQERQKLEREKIEKEKQQRQRQQKQKLQKQRQQKQKRDRELKEAEQRRRLQEKQRLQQQNKQKEKRAALEKAKIQKQKKQRQQKQKLQKQRQKQQAQKSKVKQQPKKSSGINYNDFDDIMDDDLQEMQKAGGFASSGINSKVKNNEDEYGDDFDDESPDKPEQISTKELISEADIKCLNQYMKGTTYARKNKVNAQLLNKQSKYLQVLYEFVENRKLFVFESAITKAVVDFGIQIQNPDTPQQDLRMSVQTIKQQMQRAYNQVLPGEQLFPQTRFIFPFTFKNQFNIKLLQMIPDHTYFRVIFDQALPQDEGISQKFQCLIEGLLHIFQLDGQPNLQEVIVNEESKQVLDTFDKDLPCLLLLFALHYERSNPKNIIINQYTIERIFYASNIIEQYYQVIKEGEQIQGFFEKLFEKYSNNDKITIHNVTVNSSDPEYSQALTHSSLQIKQQFKKGKQPTVLTCFAIQVEEQGEVADKIVVYMSLDKASPKPVVNYFLISKDADEQENASVIFELISQGDENFEVNVFTDFTRHNGLSSYSDWSLPLWSHVITKRKLSSLQAFRAITFAMTPYFLAFKETD